jgi:hypothetical protein
MLKRIRRFFFGLTWQEELEQLILFDIAMRGFWDREQCLEELEAFERWKSKSP